MQATHRTTKARCLATAAAFSLLLLNSGLAQTATPNAPDTTKAKPEEEVVVLSPFIVDASKDQGYRATSTLAGSRINTDLRDVASSITVVTKEFLTDVAAVNVNDILAYTANTEGTRDFTSSETFLGRPNDAIANNPNTANRLRGLASADITRDYFYTIGTWVGFDTYNLDQVTINRGPNSVLAGLGSPAGIINYSPQLAGLTRDKNEVTYRFGSFGDQRATFNSNIVAVKDVFAVRVAAAWSDKGFKQKPSYNRDKRLYLAATYQPWKKTTIRASYEVVKIKSNNPNSITPEDGVSQWIPTGRLSYDNTSSDPVSSVLFRGNNLPTVIYNKDGGIENSYNSNLGYVFEQQNLTNVGLFTRFRMNNNRYLQLDKVNLQPSLQSPLKLKTASFSVDQEIVHGLNANFSYVQETVDNNLLSLFRSEYATYSIDVNRRLPGGATNPHYGETYMQFRGLDNKQTDHNTNEVMRGTVTYDLDLTKYSKWFGRYRTTGFMEKRETETEHLQYNAVDIPRTTAEDAGTRYYMGGREANNFVATTVPGTPGLVSGVTYFNPSTGTFTNTMDTAYGLKSDSRQLVKLATSAAVLQAYLWDDRIVGMYGIRRDKNDAAFSSTSNAGARANPAQPPGPPFTTFSKTTKTYGVVVHPLKWLSFHYNRSENFVPNAGAVDLLANPTPSPTGVGKDYGFSVSLLEDKLNVKLNWFDLTASGAAAGTAADTLARWTVPWMDQVFMPSLAAQAGITNYRTAEAPGIVYGDQRLTNCYTADNVSKGLELELTYNVTKNWRVMASVAKQQAKQSNIAAPLTAFIEERLAYWRSFPQNIWNGSYISRNLDWGNNRTGEQQWNSDNLNNYLSYTSAEGKPAQQLAKWHASVLTNYAFSDGTLKGFSIGGAARYIDKSIIGNPVITNSSGAITGLDLDHPYYAGSYIAVDAWMGYKMKIYANKYDLSFQLNARDLQEGGGFRPITANSDGAHSVYRIVQPRTFYLTTTLGF